MKPRRCAFALLVGGFGVAALLCSAGVAGAQPDPSGPVVPSLIDQLITQTPVLSVNPTDEGGSAAQWGGVGMVCQNLSVKCR